MAERVHPRLSPAEGRRFGLTVGTAFLVLAAFLWWRGRGELAVGIPALLGAVFLLGGLVLPSRMGPLQRAWMGLALAISRVTTPVLMAVLFFLVFLPMGLALRALGRNPIARRSAGSTSFWVQRPARAEAPGERWRQF